MEETGTPKNTIEQQALKYGAAINLIMALAGWLAYSCPAPRPCFWTVTFPS